MIIYEIEKGDTIASIASRYGISIDDIINLNDLTNLNNLVVGQSIVLPVDSIRYTIRGGDTLYKISQKYNLSIDEILDANPQIENPDMIYAGETLNLPIGIHRKQEIEVNAYIYPNIQPSTLDVILPNLTYISVFSYDALRTGMLRPINDNIILEKANMYGVSPLLVVTNYDNENSEFSGELANYIFTNMQIRETLINNIIATAIAKGYKGVNVDFEYLNPTDRQSYINFLTRLKTRLQERDLLLFVALAPKISANQQGILYEAHDYAEIGKIADRIILMTYEWGYLYGEPQAISPIRPIMQVLDYATGVIPSNKILIGVSNYAYDWTLPYKKGTPARILTNKQAVDLAREKGAFIEFDEMSQAPFYTYYEQNSKHIVWFEDARSYYSRFKLVEKYNLAGISYWTLNNYFTQGFVVQNSLFDIKKY